MSHRAIALLLTALLTLSVLFAWGWASSEGGAAPPTVAASEVAAGHPSALLTYTIYNGFGVATHDFYPGELGAGALYFSVTDLLDHSVNVTITDPNAVVDGVPIPAYHYEAVLNTTTFTFDSYTAGVGYTFPANLPYGGTWTVNFSAPMAGTALQSISVKVYSTDLSTAAGSQATVPGEALSVFWSLHSTSNDASLYTRATSVVLSGTYTGNGTVENLFPNRTLALTAPGAGEGQWSGAIPANATPATEMHFEVSAITNVSGGVVENESANVTVDVGTLTIHGYGITPAPPNCVLANDALFPNDSLIAGCLQVGATYHAAFTPIAGLPITVGYWNGTAAVHPAGGPSALTSNASGEAAFTFPASSPPFIAINQYPRFDALNFTVSVPGASGLYPSWTQWLNATWSLVGGSSASGIVRVALDHTEYYVGNTATASWSIASTNLTRTGPVAPVAWAVTGPDAVTYATGILNTTALTGTFAFPVTSAMAPHAIEAWVYAANATAGFDGYATATVLNPSLLLTPSSLYYSAGSSPTVGVVLNGGGTLATVQYQAEGVWATGEALLASGTVANGSSLAVPIPSTAPPTSVEVSVWASLDGQVIATSGVELDLAQGYSILLGVSTPSSYSDGSYQPGQTVTLSYQVVSVGGAALPKVVTFGLVAVGYPSIDEIQNVGPSGTISYTIPSDAVAGTLLLELEAQGALEAGPCFPTGACVGVATLLINPHPSILSLELGAGSGVTVGWLILLVLVILIAVVLILLMLRRRGQPRAQAPTTIAPPAPAPSGPPAAEWKAPESPPAPEPSGEAAPGGPAADSRPPLPEPPPGSD